MLNRQCKGELQAFYQDSSSDTTAADSIPQDNMKSTSTAAVLLIMTTVVLAVFITRSTGQQIRYGTGYGATGQQHVVQQTTHQVTQTRPAYGSSNSMATGIMQPAAVMPIASTGIVQTGVPIKHVQTTRVDQIRAVPAQSTAVIG